MMVNRRDQRTAIQTLQFTLIGISNAVVDIASLNLLLWWLPSTHPVILTLFNTFAYFLAIGNSYFWNSLITFRHTAKGTRNQRVYFLLQGLLSLGIHNGVFLAFHSLFQWSEWPTWIGLNLAKAIAMFSSSAASFMMMKYFVFTASPPHKKP